MIDFVVHTHTTGGQSLNEHDPNLNDPRISVHHYPSSAQKARMAYYATVAPTTDMNDESSLQDVNKVISSQQQHQPTEAHQISAIKHNQGDINNQIGKPVVPTDSSIRHQQQQQQQQQRQSMIRVNGDNGQQQRSVINKQDNMKINNSRQQVISTSARNNNNNKSTIQFALAHKLAQTASAASSSSDENSIINVFNEDKTRIRQTSTAMAQTSSLSADLQHLQSACLTIADAPAINYAEMIIRNAENEPCYILGLSGYITVKGKYFPFKNYKPRVSQTCWQANDAIIIDVDCGYLTIFVSKFMQNLMVDTIKFFATPITAGDMSSPTPIYSTSKSKNPILVTPLNSKFVCDKTIILLSEQNTKYLVLQKFELQAIATYSSSSSADHHHHEQHERLSSGQEHFVGESQEQSMESSGSSTTAAAPPPPSLANRLMARSLLLEPTAEHNKLLASETRRDKRGTPGERLLMIHYFFLLVLFSDFFLT